jgi:hypothetical protein
MNAKPTDPAKLTAAEKDALIAALRRELAVAQSELRLQKRRTAAGAPASERPRELLEELRDTAPRKPPAPTLGVAVKLGRRLDFWRSPLVATVVAVLIVVFALDAGVGWYQARSLKQARQERLLFENTAMRSLYVELKQIAYEPDGKSYRATLFMQNVSPNGPLYVMLNAVGIYVQSGISWQQVPSRPAEGVNWGVVKLMDGYSYDVIFTPDVANWAELIPGYMHVRLQSDMLVSQSAQPGNDIVERRTPFYVYLKPQGANDEAIKARSRMSGTPPVFIPMPPH